MYTDKLSERCLATPPSFIRSILKTTENENVISFAGGLPNPVSFPKEAINESASRVIENYGSKVFQYSQTAGLLLLRDFIAQRLRVVQGIDVNSDDIIITTGSQQALDLIGKVFINEGDSIILEEPGYLGAIQAFSQYFPKFHPVKLEDDGMDMVQLEDILKTNPVKFLYAVPNFQNPSGLTYSREKREKLFQLVKKYNCILVEDDPYGDLKFEGSPYGYISKADAAGSILMGSFSKTVTPGMRLGYMVIKDKDLRFRINTAKEAADLHTNVFSQYIIYDYLTHNDLDSHIQLIRSLYSEQCATMIAAMEKYFPEEVKFTRPEGGMFIWAELPENQSAIRLFEKAKLENVVFVPGNPFYTDKREASTMRLNYTNSSKDIIMEGIRRLGKLIKE